MKVLSLFFFRYCAVLLLLWPGVRSSATEQDARTFHDYPPVMVDLDLQQISPHVWLAQGKPGVATDNEGFVSNAGVIVTGAGVVVFDALGSPSLASLLLERIHELTQEPVVRVIVSHYHADHIYGLQVFEDLGAEILAPEGSERYLQSDAARERLAERRFTLAPWVNEDTRLVAPTLLLKEGADFRLGDVDFTITVVGSAHSEGDLTLYVGPDRVLFSGDLLFDGRLPYLGDADSRHWLDLLTRMERENLTALVPGHGKAASAPNEAIALTRHYLEYLREQMGRAVEQLEPFDAAYAATDWSEFENLPAFAEANRRNAYQVYLSMEAESLEGQ